MNDVNNIFSAVETLRQNSKLTALQQRHYKTLNSAIAHALQRPETTLQNEFKRDTSDETKITLLSV